MLPLVKAHTHEITGEEPTTIEFLASNTAALAKRIDAIGPPGRQLGVRIDSMAGGAPIFLTTVPIGRDGRGVVTERVALPPNAAPDFTLILQNAASSEQTDGSASDADLAPEVWIMSIAIPEDFR